VLQDAGEAHNCDGNRGGRLLLPFFHQTAGKFSSESDGDAGAGPAAASFSRIGANAEVYPVMFPVMTSSQARAGSAPPTCRNWTEEVPTTKAAGCAATGPDGGAGSAVAPPPSRHRTKSKTYRAGRKEAARRSRVSASAASEAAAPLTPGLVLRREPSLAACDGVTLEASKEALSRAARAGSAPPAFRLCFAAADAGAGAPSVVTGCADDTAVGRHKPRRRAGQRVRERRLKETVKTSAVFETAESPVAVTDGNGNGQMLPLAMLGAAAAPLKQQSASAMDVTTLLAAVGSGGEFHSATALPSAASATALPVRRVLTQAPFSSATTALLDREECRRTAATRKEKAIAVVVPGSSKVAMPAGAEVPAERELPVARHGGFRRRSRSGSRDGDADGHRRSFYPRAATGGGRSTASAATTNGAANAASAAVAAEPRRRGRDRSPSIFFTGAPRCKSPTPAEAVLQPSDGRRQASRKAPVAAPSSAVTLPSSSSKAAPILTEHELARANAASVIQGAGKTARTRIAAAVPAASGAICSSTSAGKASTAGVARRREVVAAKAIPASNVQVGACDSDDVIGRWVLVTGLVRHPHFNGQWGLAEEYDADMQRYVVRVLMGSEGGAQPVVAKLRRENFVVVPGPASAGARAPHAAAGRVGGGGDGGERTAECNGDSPCDEEAFVPGFPWRPSLRQLAPGRAGLGTDRT
jgi:hypothetical protein